MNINFPKKNKTYIEIAVSKKDYIILTYIVKLITLTINLKCLDFKRMIILLIKRLPS